MDKILILVFGIISFAAFGQNNYEINGFSDRYKGILNIEKGYEDEVFKKGKIAIVEIKTNKTLITIESDELTFELDDKGDVTTNILELPYGKQSLIIYQDFNFDGNKDLAIMDGQFSCYHGPSFQIYLETVNGLKHSPEFTELAQEYCGMFQVDNESKTIHTFSKSGCCWHQYSEFKVQDDIPIEEKSVSVGLSIDGLLWEFVEYYREGNEMIEKSYSILNEEDIILLYSLTFRNEKKMELYRTVNDEDFLFYVFKDKDEHVELFYSGDFIYDKENIILTFTNQNTNYNIYTKGILIDLPGKKIDMKAVAISNEATLGSLVDLNLKNLKIK